MRPFLPTRAVRIRLGLMWGLFSSPQQTVQPQPPTLNDMPETVVIPHPPAIKVGGRRRSSVSSKPKPHVTGGTQSTESAVAEQVGNNDNDATTDDYPRPAPPGEGQAHQHDGHNQYQDEEQAKKTKKHPSNEKMKEYAHWKAETTRPTRDVQGNVTKAYGASGRIAQPAGKGV